MSSPSTTPVPQVTQLDLTGDRFTALITDSDTWSVPSAASVP